MAEKNDPKDMVDFKELLLSNIFEQEALINILERKGILTKTELLEEIKKLKKKHTESAN